MKTVNSIFFLFLFSLQPFFAQSQFLELEVQQAEELGLSSDSLAKMDQYFHQLVDERQLAGIQTAIIRKGKLLHFDTYGYSDIEENKMLDDQSIFRIFSMTKPIVSVALMQLYEQGKFELNDPLYKFIPEFEHMFVFSDTAALPAERKILIADLLRHTSGFSYGRTPYEELTRNYAEMDLNSSVNNKEFVEKLSRIPLQFEPGTNWKYGLSTNICGYLIEVISGKSLDEYLKENILKPLDMLDTHFHVSEEKVDRFTVGYGWNEEEGLTISETAVDNRYTRPVTLYNGGGGMVSTTYDYLKFCQMLLNKGKVADQEILKEETIKTMLSDQLIDVRKYQDELNLVGGAASFGLGFGINGNSANDLLPVFGWGGAAGTFFKIDTENDLAYVLMIQLSPYTQLGLKQKFQDFINAAIMK